VPGTPPPAPLITSALGVGLEAFVAARAAMQAGIADARAAFELTLAAPSSDWGFFVLAGLEPLVDALERLRPRVDELEWLESVGALDARSRRKLAEARFGCDLDAPPEGSVVFPGEAVLTVEGPYWQAQLVGDLILGAIAEATLVATRFARMRIASGGADVIEHGAAWAHRLGGVPTLARAAFVGGARATTSALAARRYGIPAIAIQPASLEAAVGSEDRAIRVWLASNEGECVLRLDATRASAVLPRLVANVRERMNLGDRRIAIELPSGDRAGLARAIVKAFSTAGLAPPPIVISGDVDERLALELRDVGIPGRALALSAEAAGEGVARIARYDLVSIEDGGSWSPRLRLGRDVETSSDPGRKLLVRYSDASGRPVADVSHAMNERLLRSSGGRYVDRATSLAGKLAAATSTPMRTAIMRAGKRASTAEPALLIRERASRMVAALDEGYRRVVSPARYPVGITPSLATLKAELLAKATDV
jgi:nicotinate phosphoribosyltransferase